MIASNLPGKQALLCLFVLSSLYPTSPIWGQVRPLERGSVSMPGGDAPLAQLQRRLASPPVSLPLEGALDPAAYVIGPGDIFDISIGGAVPVLLSMQVSADGYLMLGEAGSLPVAGRLLADVKARAVEALRGQYRNVQVDVSLAQPRQFYVHVSGAVPLPGRHLATPVARVSSILEQAFADSTQAVAANSDFRPSLRNVSLIRRNGEERSLDLLRYFSTGDVEANPYLQDGDIISVPTFDPAHESVFVDGAVAFPGGYAYRPGDSILDILALATGNDLPGIARQVRLTRRQPDGSIEARLFDLAGLRSGAVADEPLQPLDHLFVLPVETNRGTASVAGWVRFPGTYPIEPGRTTLQELIEVAGGLQPGALLRGAYLERRVLPAPTVRPVQGNRFDQRYVRPDVLRPDSAALLQSMRLAGLDFMSRNYFAQEMRLQNRVSVDLAHATTTGASPVYLQDGDRLVVPADHNTVYVFGQVNRPGFVNYQPGWDLDDYVAAAGGVSPGAAEAYVIEAGTGRHLDAEAAAIGSGDLIFVDSREHVAPSAALQQLHLTERQIRSQSRLQTTQIVVQVAGTLATILTTYLILRLQ